MEEKSTLPDGTSAGSGEENSAMHIPVDTRNAAGFMFMVLVFSVSLLGVFLLLSPQFSTLYHQAGLRIPFLTATLILHRTAMAIALGTTGALLTLLPFTGFYQRMPQTVTKGVLMMYGTVMGTVTLSFCMPLVQLVYRLG